MSSQLPNMISDGKRMRVVWRPGDGNGDSTTHIVERSMHLLRGHPTWKLFMDEVPSEIVRGTDEPPYYVYLDDKACYDIYCSRAYANNELRKYWPWDFNHQGNIKQGRMNRGHPAYLDDSFTVFAKGKLRGKDKWYTFSGAPESSSYRPHRPKVRSPMENQIDDEYAAAKQRGVDPDYIFADSVEEVSDISAHMEASGAGPIQNEPNAINSQQNIGPSASTLGLTLLSTRGNSPSDQITSFDNASSTFHQTRPHSSHSVPVFSGQGCNSKPQSLPPRALFGSPYGDLPRTNAKSKFTVSPAALGRFNPKHILSEATSQDANQRSPTNLTPKSSLNHSTGNGYDSPSNRAQNTPRANLDEIRYFSIDGTVEDDGNTSVDLMGTSSNECDLDQRSHPSIFHSETRNKVLQAENDQLRRDLKCAQAHLKAVSRERYHFRRLASILLASQHSQKSDLTDRVQTLQKISNSLFDISENLNNISMDASREIAPTSALCDGLSTILDTSGKYMYDVGMDEEWKTLKKELGNIQNDSEWYTRRSFHS